MSEKYDRFMESLSPGMKMIYTCAPAGRAGRCRGCGCLRLLTRANSPRRRMISAAFTLVIVTVFGGLVYYGLERKLARALR